jgi:hypothetical protein
MRLRPGSSVTHAAAAADINRTDSAGSSGGKHGGAPQDAIRVSQGFESLAILSAHQATKVAQVAVAVRSGTYAVNSAAVGKAIVQRAIT